MSRKVVVRIMRDIPPELLPLRIGPFYARTSFVEYDARAPRPKKIHQLIHQQGSRYGTVGDRCAHLRHDELLDLVRQGYLEVRR